MSKKNYPEKEERDPLALFIKQSTQWVHKYFISLVGILSGALLAFGLSLLYSYWQSEENKKGAEFLYQARQVLEQVEKKHGGNILPAGTVSAQDFFKTVKTIEYNTELKQAANQYQTVVEEWISKPVGLSATIELAYFLNQYKQSSQALELLKKASPYKTKNLKGFLVALQLGTYLIDVQEYAGALEEFKFITQNEEAKWLWPSALIKQALCLEKQGKTLEAQAIYKQIEKDFSNSPSSTEALKYSRLLKLQSKLKNQEEKNAN